MPSPLGQVLSPSDRKSIVEQARRAYHRLSPDGLAELRCEFKPDYDSIFAQLKVDTVAQHDLLAMLKNVRFRIVIGPDGASIVSHDSDAPPPNEEMAQKLRQSIAGVEQVATGFLQTWTPFALTSPLPVPNADYKLEDLGQKYRLTDHEGKADATIIMGRDFAIDEISVSAPEFSGVVHPTLGSTKDGFVLVGYEATYTVAGAGTSQELSVKVDYGDVDGAQLPSVVNATVSLPNGKVTMPFRFSAWVVKRRAVP